MAFTASVFLFTKGVGAVCELVYWQAAGGPSGEESSQCCLVWWASTGRPTHCVPRHEPLQPL